jgi:hypothetical protein
LSQKENFIQKQNDDDENNIFPEMQLNSLSKMNSLFQCPFAHNAEQQQGIASLGLSLFALSSSSEMSMSASILLVCSSSSSNKEDNVLTFVAVSEPIKTLFGNWNLDNNLQKPFFYTVSSNDDSSSTSIVAKSTVLI